MVFQGITTFQLLCKPKKRKTQKLDITQKMNTTSRLILPKHVPLASKAIIALPEIIMEVDGLIPWTTIFLYKQQVPSTSMLVTRNVNPLKCSSLFFWDWEFLSSSGILDTTLGEATPD